MPPMPAKPARAAVNGSALRDNSRLLGLFVEAQRALKARDGAAALLPLREILKTAPNHPDGLNLSSVALGQVGHRDDALRLARQAVALKPEDAQFRLNLGNR